MPLEQGDTSTNETKPHSIYNERIVKGSLKHILFGISYSNTTLRTGVFAHQSHWDNYNEITPNVFLGRLPSTDIEADIDALFGDPSNEDRGLIVACNDYFELAGVGAHYQNVVAPAKWEESHKICHHMVMIPDFTAKVENTLMLDTLALMREYSEANKPIYIHCKAGRSRSTMMLALHMIQMDPAKYVVKKDDGSIDGKESFLKAVVDIKAKRPHVSVGDKIDKAAHLLECEFNLETNTFPIPYAGESYTDTREFTQSDKFLSQLVQTVEFKKLMIYLNQQCAPGAKRLETVKGFLAKIGEENWYEQLVDVTEGRAQASNPLKHFCESKPWRERITFSVDQSNAERLTLLKGLQEAIDQVVKNETHQDLVYGQQANPIETAEASATMRRSS